MALRLHTSHIRGLLMQVVLVMFKHDGSRRSFSLHKPVTILGRREDCDVRIPLGEISRKHCRLVRDDDSIRIEDLGSSNGTIVNGERVQSTTLAAGDTLQVGPVLFVVQLDGLPADEDIIPPGTAKPVTDDEADDTPSHLEPTAVAEAGDDQPFDPATILDGPNDSAVSESLDNSALAHDIAADLERANRGH